MSSATDNTIERYTREQVAEQCRRLGPTLALPGGIDGARLLWAIAGAESSFGANCAPRHENAYDFGGVYDRGVQLELLAKYGPRAASSYGPWQVLVCNAAPCSPEQLASDLGAAAEAAARHVQNWCVRFRGAKTLEQIAEAYNSGNFHANPPAGVLRYGEDVRQYYEGTPLPASVI